MMFGEGVTNSQTSSASKNASNFLTWEHPDKSPEVLWRGLLKTRTWQNALDAIVETKTGSTQDHWHRAAKQTASRCRTTRMYSRVDNRFPKGRFGREVLTWSRPFPSRVGAQPVT